VITNRQRYEDRHVKICARAERQFAEQRAKGSKLTVPKAVKAYAAAVHHAVSGRDCIAAVYAVCATHLAMKVDINFAQSGD
jgi:hypothetical protein